MSGYTDEDSAATNGTSVIVVTKTATDVKAETDRASSNQSDASGSTSVPTGVIIGATLGGVVVLGFLILFFVYRRRLSKSPAVAVAPKNQFADEYKYSASATPAVPAMFIRENAGYESKYDSNL